METRNKILIGLGLAAVAGIVGWKAGLFGKKANTASKQAGIEETPEQTNTSTGNSSTPNDPYRLPSDNSVNNKKAPSDKYLAQVKFIKERIL